MCTAAVHLGLQFHSLDYFAHKFGLGLSTQRSSYFVRNRTYGHDFLRVQFFSTKFLHTRFSVGGASLLENWILEGDEQGDIPVNGFVCSVHRFRLNFLWSKVINE